MDYNDYIDDIRLKTKFVDELSKAFENNEETTIKKLSYEVFLSNTGSVQEYLVALYRGDAIAVRSCNYDSLNAIVDEVAKLSHGGYYQEVSNYNKIKKENMGIYSLIEDNFVIS